MVVEIQLRINDFFVSIYGFIIGFGKDTERSEVYIIPIFGLSIGDVSFYISNLLIAQLFKPFIGCDLLLSETMFAKADTLTIRRGKRELVVTFDNIGRPFICTPKTRNKEALSVAVWSQE